MGTSQKCYDKQECCDLQDISVPIIVCLNWWHVISHYYWIYFLACFHSTGSDGEVIEIIILAPKRYIQYIPRNMHTVFALLCFVVVIHWLIFPYPSGLLHWHCGNLTIAPVPAKQPWWIWSNTSCEFIMNDCITTTKQSTTKPCAYFLGYTVFYVEVIIIWWAQVGINSFIPGQNFATDIFNHISCFY